MHPQQPQKNDTGIFDGLGGFVLSALAGLVLGQLGIGLPKLPKWSYRNVEKLEAVGFNANGFLDFSIHKRCRNLMRCLQKLSKSYHHTANFASPNAKFSVDG